MSGTDFDAMAKTPLPIRVLGKWIRFKETVNYAKPNCNIITGGKETGKSALAEALTTHYTEQHKDCKVLDFWGCYDEETEVFTKDGWKFFRDINFLDKIMTLNLEKSVVEFHNPTALQMYDYDGLLLSFGGKHSRFDLLVTPDHNMLVRRRYYSHEDLQFMKASEILAYSKCHSRCLPFALVRKVPWHYRDIRYFELHSANSKAPSLEKVLMDHWLRLFAWYISEGNVHRIANNKKKHWYQYRVEICQKPSKAKCAEITKAFRDLGLRPKQYREKIFVNSKVLYDHLKQFGNAETKYLPKWLKHLPPEKLRIYIETALKGDGYGRVYYTSSKQLADDFQEICMRAGYNASIGVHATRKKYGFIRGRQIKGILPAYSISINQTNRDTEILGTQIETVPYHGKIYDVTVPNHTLLVRRHGKVTWCGNSRDCEGLSWCRSPYKDSVLFVTGDSVKVRSRWPSVSISDFSLAKCKHYRCILTVSAFYSNQKEEFDALRDLMNVLWKRDSWDHVWTILFRELANLIYSRISIGQNEAEAKAYVLSVLNEMRHMGYAVCGDAIRNMSIDVNLRTLADYTFIKACGKEGLPKEMDYLYAYFKPFSIMRMPINQFIIVSRTGTLGRGVFECPPWHKHENESLLKLFNIEREYGEAPDLNTKAGRINDREHVKIVKARHEGLDGEPLSFNKLAVRCDRSTSTVFNAVTFHNTDIERKGFCEKCKRMNAPLVNTKV